MKIKSIKSIKKRFIKTGKCKLKYKPANLRHLLTKKNRKRKRHLKKKKILKTNNLKLIKLGLPYK